jgi:hypothetical protein
VWANNVFFKLFFFVPGPFQGGHFFGEIIYFSALDLKPASLNLRPALVGLYDLRVLHGKVE